MAVVQTAESIQRFVYRESLDVPIRGRIIQIDKEAATGWLNLSTMLQQLKLDRTPRVLKNHLERICNETQPDVETRLLFRQDGRPRPHIWADPQIALELLNRLIGFGNVDLSKWAVKRAFCAVNDCWYIYDPAAVIPNIRALRTFTEQDGAGLLTKHARFFENDKPKLLLCEVLQEVAEAFQQGGPVVVADLSPLIIKQLFEMFQASGLFLEAPPPTIASISAMDISTTDEKSDGVTEETQQEVSWTVPNQELAKQLYAEPAIVRQSNLFQQHYPDPATNINFNNQELLANFYEREKVELYELYDQHCLYKSLKEEHKMALDVVAVLELIFKVFKDRFVFQPYQDLVSRKAIIGAEMLPSGLHGHASPQIPLAVLLHVVERFCRDNPGLPYIPNWDHLHEPKLRAKVLKVVSAYLSYRPDYEHAQVDCQNQEQVGPGPPESRRKPHRSGIVWPKENIAIPGRSSSFYEPRVFLDCDLVRNVDLRVPFVPWTFVQQSYDRFTDWFNKTSDHRPNKATRATSASSRGVPASHLNQDPDRERVIEYIKQQYATRRCWTFSSEILVPDKHIGTLYVPFVSLWIKLFTKRRVHVEPVDESDCSVYAPLYAVLQTISSLHPAIHVLMRFLTAEQAIRLFTMLKWIRKLELSERIYPRYGVANPETHVSRLDVFVQDHDLIAYQQQQQ